MKPALTETSQPGDISPATPPTTTLAKARKTRKVKSARAPRVADPAIAQIRLEAKQRVAAHRLELKSAAKLVKIEVALDSMSSESHVKLHEILEAKLRQRAATT